MPKRSKDWNEVLARKLQEPKFARKYIEAALAEGLPIQTALAQVIRAMGVVEYARKVKMAPPNLQRILRSKANPTFDTLQRLLAPLGLTVSVVETSHRNAA